MHAVGTSQVFAAADKTRPAFPNLLPTLPPPPPLAVRSQPSQLTLAAPEQPLAPKKAAAPGVTLGKAHAHSRYKDLGSGGVF